VLRWDFADHPALWGDDLPAQQAARTPGANPAPATAAVALLARSASAAPVAPAASTGAQPSSGLGAGQRSLAELISSLRPEHAAQVAALAMRLSRAAQASSPS
jgi:hypothetical protein